MQVESELINIKKTDYPSVEYIENELIQRGINPLRWAIVSVDEESYAVSVANLRI